MKKILITGKNSYIGMSFENWLTSTKGDYQIDTLDMRDSSWKEYDFSPYDVVFHVAGIAHADVSKVSDETKQLYYKVNTELTVATAEKYKRDRKNQTSQFIFMSSIIIYGEEMSINKPRVITPETPASPSNFYGDSKWQAELGLQPLESDTFHLVIVRPPMIYGSGSKGNYQQLKKLALKLPVFPDIKNKRSMLFIDNLNQFLKQIIDAGSSGIFFPQNEEYVRTSHMVKEIAETHGKKIYLFSWMNWAVKLLGYMPGKVGKLTNKAFGTIYYKDVHGFSVTREENK